MSGERPIYLDNHATTRCDPRVLEAMLPWFGECYGNAASVEHAYGWEAAEAVARAREEVAALIQADPREIVFTSGATEANNLALKGALAAAGSGARLVTSAAEHRAILDPARRLERAGFGVAVLPVDRCGTVGPAAIDEALRREPATLVSIMAANNEVGTLSPLDEIGAVCRGRGALLHTDAAQAIGRVPFDVRALPVDLASISAHKLYGPKGVGALWVRRRRRIRIEPLLDGGGHENRLRSGTLPVPLIVGFGAACRIVRESLLDESRRIAALRDRLWDSLNARISDLRRNGDPERRLPGNLNVSVPGVDGDALLAGLKEIAVSSGSACSTADPEPSHVLRAMGVSEDLCRASLRFGLGRFNTADEIDRAAAIVAGVVQRLREGAAVRAK
ncbi:MAG: cysteine desulfurase family protein [Planctomycetales bacterium]